MPRGASVNVDAYCETLKILRWAIKNQGKGPLCSDILLLYDNVQPLAVMRTKQLFEFFVSNVF